MPDAIIIAVAYDHEAKVWYIADCLALPGLLCESDTLEELLDRLPRLAKAPLEHDRADLQPRNMPIEVRIPSRPALLEAAVAKADPSKSQLIGADT